MTTEAIGKANILVGANTDKLDAGLKKAKQSINGFSTSFGGVSFFGSGPLGAVVAGASTLATFASDYVDNIQKMGDKAEGIMNASQAFGISTDEFQALSNAAKLSGIEIDTFEKGWKSLAGVIVDAQGGNADAAKKLQDLGFAASAFDGKSVTDSFTMVGGAIDKIQSPMARLKAAGDIFGEKSGFKLLPAIGKDFSDTVKDIAKYSIDKTSLKSLDEAADKWTKLGMAYDSAKTNLAGSGTSGAVADALRSGLVDPVNARLFVNNADNAGLSGLMTKGAFGRDILGDNTDYEKVAAKIQSIRKQEQELKDARTKSSALKQAADEIARKKNDENVKTTNDVIKATDNLFASINRTPGELDTWKKSQEGVTGELLKTIAAENQLQDALRAASPLIKQSPYQSLQQQLMGLDALLANGRISQDQFFQGIASAGNGLIGQANLGQQTRMNPEALVAGSNDAIRTAINDRMDIAAQQSPADLLASAVSKLNDNSAQQVQQGADMVRLLRDIAKSNGTEVTIK